MADVPGRLLPRIIWKGLIRNGLDYLVTSDYVEASNRRSSRAYEALEDINTEEFTGCCQYHGVSMTQNGKLPTWLESVFRQPV
jgi:hypothetical protein